MSFLGNINWRAAIKQFDTTKPVSDADINSILEAIRLAPTAFGTQSFRAIVITNPELKEKLAPHAWNQPQITTSSHLIVFVARKDLATLSDEFFTELSGGNAEVRAQLSGFEEMVANGPDKLTGDSAIRYSSEQAHIALGFGLAAAAELKIDSCAMTGFLPNKFAEVLELSENEVPCVLLAIGYRDPSETPRDKFRIKSETLFTKIN